MPGVGGRFAWVRCPSEMPDECGVTPHSSGISICGDDREKWSGQCLDHLFFSHVRWAVRILNRAAQSLWKLPGRSATPASDLDDHLSRAAYVQATGQRLPVPSWTCLRRPWKPIAVGLWRGASGIAPQKKLALEKIRVEEGCVDLDPPTWSQAAESDGTGKPETTGTTCSCSVDSYVTRLRQTSWHGCVGFMSADFGVCPTVLLPPIYIPATAEICRHTIGGRLSLGSACSQS